LITIAILEQIPGSLNIVPVDSVVTVCAEGRGGENLGKCLLHLENRRMISVLAQEFVFSVILHEHA
jgi:hypothetical protein